MKLKTHELEGKTYAEVQDGKPVYVDESGKDVAFDAPHSVQTISRLNGEAKGHREAKEAAEAKLKGFDGIDDAAAAIKALEIVRNLDSKQLIEAGKVDEIKAAAIAATEEKMQAALKAKDGEIAERDKKIGGLTDTLNNELIGGGFNRSEFVSARVEIPADMLQARFGKNFTVEEGQLVATDNAGNKIYSKSKPGELAGFDEAIELLIDQYPQKDRILKGRQHSGSGAEGGDSGGGGMSMSLSEFNKLGAKERAEKMAQKGFTVTD